MVQLKHLGTRVTAGLTSIFNLSIYMHSYFCWKQSTIIPFLTSGKSANDRKFYRPISLSFAPHARLMRNAYFRFSQKNLRSKQHKHRLHAAHSMVSTVKEVLEKNHTAATVEHLQKRQSYFGTAWPIESIRYTLSKHTNWRSQINSLWITCQKNSSL